MHEDHSHHHHEHNHGDHSHAPANFGKAFAKLEAGDDNAMPAFAALVGAHAEDRLANFHLKRLLNGAKGVRMELE